VRLERKSFLAYAWDLRLFRHYLLRSDCIFLGAWPGTQQGSTLIGYAVAIHDGSRAELDSIAVANTHRCRGVALGLSLRLISLLRRRGVSSISLMVRFENTAAITLYRKLGFVRLRRINGYYEDGAAAWRMQMLL